MKEAEVTYLYHSGFAIELKNKILIFDYFKDEGNQVETMLAKGKKIFFFSSHSHYDHFAKKIMAFEERVERYFLSDDIAQTLKKKNLPKEKITYLSTYDAYEDREISVKSFDSTDKGVCFFVEVDGWHIFHAGDFNWWHWKDDIEANNDAMKNLFMKQMEKLEGLRMDIAFFPVDLRLEEFCDLGVKTFCERLWVENLIAMHNAENKLWKAPTDFPSKNRGVSLWIPKEPGESLKFIK